MQPTIKYPTHYQGMGSQPVVQLNENGIAVVKKLIVERLGDSELSHSNLLPLIKLIKPVSELHVFADFPRRDKLCNLTTIFLTMIQALPETSGYRKYTEDNIYDLIESITIKNVSPEVALANMHAKMDKRCCSIL